MYPITYVEKILTYREWRGSSDGGIIAAQTGRHPIASNRAPSFLVPLAGPRQLPLRHLDILDIILLKSVLFVTLIVVVIEPYRGARPFGAPRSPQSAPLLATESDPRTPGATPLAANQGTERGRAGEMKVVDGKLGGLSPVPRVPTRLAPWGKIPPANFIRREHSPKEKKTRQIRLPHLHLKRLYHPHPYHLSFPTLIKSR